MSDIAILYGGSKRSVLVVLGLRQITGPFLLPRVVAVLSVAKDEKMDILAGTAEQVFGVGR